jgi:TonB family protein
MDTQEKMAASPVASHLAEAQSRAEGGNYAGALAEVRAAKALEPKNVYILAFEKQAEQLGTLESSKLLTDESRTDILESIPAIIEKAVELSHNSSGVTDVTGLGKPVIDLARERQEKAAALEWLKNQYFQHAHEYVRKGEYQHALAEIRRVYIIDTDNRIARDFEKQIEQLAQLKTQHTTKSHPAIISEAAVPAPSGMLAPSRESPIAHDTEPLPVLTEEWSSPQRRAREAQSRAVKGASPPTKKKGSGFLIALIIISAIVLGLILYWYYQRNVMLKKNQSDGNSLSAPSAEQFIGAPTETEEQSFVVSDSSAGSETSTPEVTQIPPAETKKKSPPAQEKVIDRSAAGTLRIPETARNAAADKPVETPAVKNDAGSTLQATTTAPSLQPPAAEQKPPDTVVPMPFVAVEKEARIIKLERPKFSSVSYQRGIEGQVVVQVRIDATGKPLQTVTLKSTNDLLVQPVIDAVMASEFAPAEMSTGPVASWLTIPFKFARRE